MVALSKNKIKWVRSLRLKKNRDTEQLFVAEGTKIVLEFLKEFPESIECVITTDEEFKAEVDIYLTDDASMKTISSLSTPSSLLAVVKKPSFKAAGKGWTLALDGVQDPGNLGTIIRTADWFGINEIICSQNTVDCFNPKVIQSTMGSIFRVNVRYGDLSEQLNQDSRPVYGALLKGDNINAIEIPENGILLMGNEGNGISEELMPFITHPVHIPGKGGAESLNVAVATGILLSKLIS